MTDKRVGLEEEESGFEEMQMMMGWHGWARRTMITSHGGARDVKLAMMVEEQEQDGDEMPSSRSTVLS